MNVYEHSQILSSPRSPLLIPLRVVLSVLRGTSGFEDPRLKPLQPRFTNFSHLHCKCDPGFAFLGVILVKARGPRVGLLSQACIEDFSTQTRIKLVSEPALQWLANQETHQKIKNWFLQLPGENFKHNFAQGQKFVNSFCSKTGLSLNFTPLQEFFDFIA